MKLLITGTSGFLGSNLLKKMVVFGYPIIAPVRKLPVDRIDGISYIVCDDLFEIVDNKEFFFEVDICIHIAAIAHIKDVSQDTLFKYNTTLSVSLAQTAAKFNVKRFVFISTIGVNGPSNTSAFHQSDVPNPADCYSLSKFKAEVQMKAIVKSSNLDLVILRPPLVYGKNAPGNFKNLISLSSCNLPLPLGLIKNNRSFVFVDNLIDLIITCIHHQHTINDTFLVSDDEDISSTDFLNKIITVSGKKTLLFPVPYSLLVFFASIIGKKNVLHKFCSSLTINIDHTKKTLSWLPPYTLDEGIRSSFLNKL